MKKILGLAFCAVLVSVVLSSCSSSPYKKRKKCSGKGGWYGNRNLGMNTPAPQLEQTYVWQDYN